MELKKLIEESHKTAKEHGFWDKPRNKGELLMLIVSELGEALEADRHGKEISQDDMDYLWSIKDKPEFIHEFKARGKDTYTDEIADTFIRLFDLCGGQGIDIERQIELKMKFNEARERLNGKKY